MRVTVNTVISQVPVSLGSLLLSPCQLSPSGFFVLFFSYLFILRERVGEGQRERERVPSRLHTVSVEPHVRFELPTRKIMTGAEIKSRALN